MNRFYTELKQELENSGGDIWIETVLTGERAGEKRLLHDCPEKAGVSSGAAGAEDVFRERISLTPKLVIFGGGH